MKVEHERAVALRMRIPSARVEIPWRTHGILLRAVFFGLTLLGVVALRWCLDEMQVAKPGIPTGIGAILLAEVLILGARWWWTGVEEALWIGGAYALINELPDSGQPEAMLVLAAGAAVPGARVRNPLFGAVAAGFVAAYFEEKWDLGVLAAVVIAAIAVLGLLRTWRRPSNEWLCIAVAIILPVVGRFDADPIWRTVTIIFYGAFAAMALFLFVRKRHHALFFSGAVSLGIGAIELAELTPLRLEGKLAVGGAILLGGAWIASRALRGRVSGIVATPSKLTAFDDEIEIAATISVPQPEFDQKMESGGEFGGAGATGKY